MPKTNYSGGRKSPARRVNHDQNVVMRHSMEKRPMGDITFRKLK